MTNLAASFFKMSTFLLLLVFMNPQVIAQVDDSSLEISPKGEKLVLTADFTSGAEIEVRLGSLVERDSSGKKVREEKLNFGKKSPWSESQFLEGYDSNLIFSEHGNTFKKSEDWIKSRVIFGTFVSTIVENFTPCTDCIRGAGECINNARTCRAATASANCPRRFTPCSTEISIEKDLLRLFLNLRWDFQDPTNKLHLNAFFKVKKADKESNFSDLSATGLLSFPNSVLIHNPDGTESFSPIDVRLVQKKQKSSVEFIFPAAPQGALMSYGRVE